MTLRDIVRAAVIGIVGAIVLFVTIVALMALLTPPFVPPDTPPY